MQVLEKSRWLPVVAVSAGLVLAGCGGSGTSTSTSAVSSSAAPSAASSQAAVVAKGSTVPLADLNARMQAAMKAAGTAHAELTTGDQAMGGDFDFAATPATFSLSSERAGEQVTMLFIDKVLYLGGNSLTGVTDKKWIKLDPAATDDPMSGMVAPLFSAFASISDPTALTSGITDATATVTGTSGGQVSYSIELTPAQVKAMTDALATKLLGTAAPAATASPAGQTIELTVDAQDRPLMMAVKEGTSSKTITAKYSQWGTAPAITAPPASEVTSFADLQKKK